MNLIDDTYNFTSKLLDYEKFGLPSQLNSMFSSKVYIKILYNELEIKVNITQKKISNFIDSLGN